MKMTQPKAAFSILSAFTTKTDFGTQTIVDEEGSTPTSPTKVRIMPQQQQQKQDNISEEEISSAGGEATVVSITQFFYFK